MSTEDNRSLVRRYREIYSSNQLEALDTVLAPDFTPHNRMEMPGLPPGLEGIKQIHLGTLAAFPDLRIMTEELIAEGDKVVEVWTMTMTHTGVSIFGAPANSGKAVRTWGMSVYRIANGKIVEHWGEMDFVAVLIQLGLMPSP
jgi:predicted ester cyclase